MDLTKIQTLLIAVFGLVIIGAGIALAAKSKKAQYADTARTGVTVFVAIVIVAIGIGGLSFAAFGKSVLTQFGVGG